MKHYQSITLWLVVFLLSAAKPIGESSLAAGYGIAKSMFANTKTIQSLSYVMTKQERINGKMVKQQSFTKFTKSPFRVYIRQQAPKNGLEVLYVKGQNNNKALINPNGFPWITIKANPMGSLMREKQHHTLYESGFDHVVSILEYLCQRYESQINSMIKNEGSITWDGRPCWIISFNNPYFKYEKYTVKKGETVLDIAAQRKLSEYMILEHNELNDYDDISEGDVIEIPNAYSPKLTLYVDKQRNIPMFMEVYDDKGLYEHYEYSDVVVNPSFNDEEFSKTYAEYGF
ncbi:MAG: DUF1571 domain-containing protein [Flammeovirgaceae bacterium]